MCFLCLLVRLAFLVWWRPPRLTAPNVNFVFAAAAAAAAAALDVEGGALPLLDNVDGNAAGDTNRGGAADAAADAAGAGGSNGGKAADAAAADPDSWTKLFGGISIFVPFAVLK
jgi:hypothetical protein